MIAQIFILLPYRFAVPAGSALPAFDMTLDGQTARVFPPYRSQVDRSTLDVDSPNALTSIADQIGPQVPPETTEQVLIDGSPTVLTDALCIEFRREDFDRRSEAEEPLVDIAFQMANDLLARLRTLGRAGQVKPVGKASTTWHLVYANDDASELEPQDGFRRGLGGVSWQWQLFGLRKEVWLAAGGLSDSFAPTAWDTLFLDALDLLPEVGPALVLLLAAVETRLETALDLLAREQTVDAKLWEWLNGRGRGRRRGPTLAEQADSLLEAVAGHSLKEDERLWNAFQDLRKARNSFVHDGQAAVDGVLVTADRASGLVRIVGEIIDWVEQLLPSQHRRPRYEGEGEQFLQLTKWMTSPSATESAIGPTPPGTQN
jgi:hypothetical protein